MSVGDKSSPRDFRSDINALRALAVTLVVLFHFFTSMVPGGFIGVDIFFVISGYLMAALLTERPTKSVASYFSFIQRRASRILPELLFFIFITLLIAISFFPSFEIYAFTTEAFFSVLQIANFGYVNQLDYFADLSHSKWLLHTWSLSLEMQIYFLYPFIIIAIRSLSKMFPTTLHGIFLFLTFALTAVTLASSFPRAAFYLLPFRAWEFLGGTLAFYLVTAQTGPSLKRLTLTGSFLVLAIVVSFVDQKDIWPNMTTILTVVSVMAVLITNCSSIRIINWSPIQFIGNVSYSWYLWHWPIAVFIYKIDYQESHVAAALGTTGSLIIAYLSYYFFSRWGTQFRSLGIPSLAALTFLLISLLGISRSFSISPNTDSRLGVHNTITPSPLRSQCHAGDGYVVGVANACVIKNGQVVKNSSGARNTAIFGDSHGVELAYALSYETKVLQLTYSACGPFSASIGIVSGCDDWRERSIERLVTDDTVETVVLVWRYGLYADAKNSTLEGGKKQNEALASALTYIVDQLTSAGKTVMLMEPIPTLNKDVRRSYFAAHLGFNNPSTATGVSLGDYFNAERDTIGLLNGISESHPSVTTIKTHRALCQEQGCKPSTSELSLYFDDNHPSVYGAKRLVGLIVNNKDYAPSSDL